MKRILCAAAVIALAVSGRTVRAQDTRTHTESVTKSGDTKVKTESVSGVVKAYEAGKSIKVAGPHNKSYSFDLDENASVEGTVVVGQKAKVTYTKGDGTKRVTVVSAATGEAPAETMAPKSYTESTTKSSSPSGTTKVKSQTVIGMVKEFEEGKKIVVTGPKRKDYSFDLDGNVVMSGTVAVGDRVKVTYTKGDGGHKKVTLVSAYSGKA